MIGEVLERGRADRDQRRPSADPGAPLPTGVAVSTIIVNHERRDLLKMCLESLERALRSVDEDTELIVVDNGSGDGSVELVREQLPRR